MEKQIISMYHSLDEAIKDIWGQGVKIKGSQSISGGDINKSYRLSLTNGEKAFLKINRKADKKFFPSEANGLMTMGEAGANVPKVIGYGNTKGGAGFLLLSYEQGNSQIKAYWSLLGQMLAKMHLSDTKEFVKSGAFGFYEDNFIGATVQINSPKSGWVEFFQDEVV